MLTYLYHLTEFVIYNQFKRQQQYILQFAIVAHKLNRLTPPGLKQQCLAEPIPGDIDDPYLKPIPQ